MKEFIAKVVETPEQIVIELSGFFDESSQLPSLKTNKTVSIKFQNLTLMNSYGIKTWCRWADEHKALPLIILEECPFVFTKNFSSIRGFLNPNMKVKSFYIPFYNDDSLETKEVLMELDKDFTNDGFIKVPKAVDSHGAPMELDVNGSAYFQFLKKP